jgi:hypothetical protein
MISYFINCECFPLFLRVAFLFLHHSFLSPSVLFPSFFHLASLASVLPFAHTDSIGLDAKLAGSKAVWQIPFSLQLVPAGLMLLGLFTIKVRLFSFVLCVLVPLSFSPSFPSESFSFFSPPLGYASACKSAFHLPASPGRTPRELFPSVLPLRTSSPLSPFFIPFCALPPSLSLSSLATSTPLHSSFF